MPIVWRSKGGVWKNFSATGKGELYNSDTKIIKKGNFSSGSKLTDANGTLIDYSGTDGAFIYVGNFEDSSKKGALVRYTIPSQEWKELLASKTGKVLGVVKEQCVYDNDTLISSDAAAPVNIKVSLALLPNSSDAISRFDFSS